MLNCTCFKNRLTCLSKLVEYLITSAWHAKLGVSTNLLCHRCSRTWAILHTLYARSWLDGTCLAQSSQAVHLVHAFQRAQLGRSTLAAGSPGVCLWACLEAHAVYSYVWCKIALHFTAFAASGAPTADVLLQPEAVSDVSLGQSGGGGQCSCQVWQTPKPCCFSGRTYMIPCADRGC